MKENVLYLLLKLLKKLKDGKMNIERIPDIFQVRTNHEYPPYNTMIFEEYFMNYFVENFEEYFMNYIDVEYTYLSVLWTNFYIGRNYGNSNMDDLQKYLNSLDRNKKYFTIVQYDDGVLQDIDDLDLFIFGSGGGGRKVVPDKNLGYPIPLICMPYPNINSIRKKDTLCSFVGAINRKIREKIRDLYSDDFFIRKSLRYSGFSDEMERSVFSLCPRGYGATSFRICEALQRGSIPVYIYDKPWIPWVDEFDFNKIGILIHESNIGSIKDIINSKTEEEISQYRMNGQRIYEEYFSFEGCAKQIINKLCQ